MENQKFICTVKPLIFCPTSEQNINELSYSNKVILNSKVLETLSKNIDNLESPMVFKVTNNTVFGTYETFIGVHDFTALGDNIYMPNHIIEKIFAETDAKIEIEYYVPPKGSYIKLKPQDKNFYEIENIKTNLESIITKNYPVIELNNILEFKYCNPYTGDDNTIKLTLQY